MKVCGTCRLRYDDQVSFCLVDGQALEAVSDPRIGSVVGHYTLDEVIGRGGMAAAYRAHRPHAERDVAIKVLHERFADDASFRERLEREARSAAQLAHPNIVEIYDVGTTDDAVPFLAMELLEGDPLDQHIQRSGMLAPAEVVALGLQIARGLSRAHDFGVVHRDVKPENVFVCRSDDQQPVVKLVDFGIAVAAEDPRLTGTGELLGSPRYMAPERFTDRSEVSPSSDLYSLGVVLYEMASGRLPFESASLAGFVVHHMESDPPRLNTLVDVPARLDQLVHELLAKNPSHRPVDAHAVVSVLSSMATDHARRVRRVTAVSQRRQGHGETQRLDGWAQRAEVYQRMFVRAWPSGGAPQQVASGVPELQECVVRLSALHRGARELEATLATRNESLRVDRERLGHAMQTLAEDLSSARAARRARAPDVPMAELAADYRRALAEVIALDARPVPSLEGLEALRAASVAYEGWLGAVAESGVADIEFQLEAIRAQLDRIERDAEANRAVETHRLELNSHERRRLEARLLELTRVLQSHFRSVSSVRDLFESLKYAPAS